MATVKQSCPGVPADAGKSIGPSFVKRGSDAPLPAPGPWNPGLRSPIPRAVQPLCTLFRPENAFTSLAEVRELSDFTGLPEVELVAFRPRRLAVHELLIRVAANLSIPDEEDTDALGVNFRRVARTIEERCFDAMSDTLDAGYEALHARVLARASAALDEVLAALETSPPTPRRGLRARLGLSTSRSPPERSRSRVEREDAALAAWRRRGTEGEREEEATYRALVQVVGAIRARHGRIVGDRDLLARIAANRVCNEAGSERMGALIEPGIEAAIDAEGLRRLPAQERPVVMNCKGASASGKSSMRPRQRTLAGHLGVDWADFAVLSPDIFRKYLLDYDALGDAYRYAGMLTGEELAIVDRKLDRYMAEKATRGKMSHLLIDRFRFDSFAPESDEPGSNLLTRFGTDIYLFFMVTPPHATVERAWERGLRVGRYKTVDDLLHHNIEAFTGMPELLFTWARDEKRNVHYEFLDNGVPHGDAPRTIAFGDHGALVVLDVPAMQDIDRYRKINVHARGPDAVYPAPSRLAPARNADFLRACTARLARVDFADPRTARIYLRAEAGRAEVLDEEVLAKALSCPDTAAALRALFPAVPDSSGDGSGSGSCTRRGPVLDPRQAPTLGRWGAEDPP